MSTRCCAFNSCTNNSTKIIMWKKQFCEVHNITYGLGSCICEPPFYIYPFPTERKDNYSRQKWASIVNRKNGSENWKPKEDSRVCSEHFMEGRPTAANPYQTLKLGYTPHKPITSRPPPKEMSAISLRNPTKRKRLEVELISESTCSNIPQSDSRSVYNSSIETDREIQTGTESDQIAVLEAKIKKLELELESKDKTNILPTRFQVGTVHKSDAKVKFYTGLPNVASFNAVFKSISPNLEKVRYWKGQKRLCNPLKQKNKFSRNIRTLSAKEEMLICLLKLRLGLINEDIADRFGVSTTHVSSVFTTWLKLLSLVLGSLVFNPPQEVVKANLPPSFKNNTYRDVRHVIDCTEIFIETPNNLKVAAQTWCDYKHHHTAKILVSITPSGMINYVSEAWGGRTSDKFVTLNSGFLNIVQPYDKVMADKGFPIREELALLHAELLIPPGRRGVSQMSVSDVEKQNQLQIAAYT
ncbi:hypothetical protein FSP39_006157 [Pinctada imbricata]|uniref:THAP-type domain-containing protein n=1 Tax=Pinctada imbricata TaxID=66713 RepID=A0AA88YHT5_PINIB|nr:hypothetical protein FSP39_006157 [Pinctada imbricata]